MSMHDYQETINEHIGPAWLKLLGQYANQLATGNVRVHFEIRADGLVVNSQITLNTGNRELGQVALAAIQSVRLPPIPVEVLEGLPDRQLRAEYGFTVIQSYHAM